MLPQDVAKAYLYIFKVTASTPGLPKYEWWLCIQATADWTCPARVSSSENSCAPECQFVHKRATPVMLNRIGNQIYLEVVNCWHCL